MRSWIGSPFRDADRSNDFDGKYGRRSCGRQAAWFAEKTSLRANCGEHYDIGCFQIAWEATRMNLLQEPNVLHLAELFNHIDDVRAWIKDSEHRICWVNRTTFVLYSPDDPAGRGILGKTDHDLFPAFLADQYLLDDEYVLAGNRIVDRVEMNRLPDGTYVWHVTNKVPLVGQDGMTIGTAGITRPLDNSEAGATGTEFGPVLAYMRDHHDTSITNEQMARLAHMSLRTFERKFLSCFHLTPQAYLRKLRLRMASHALVYTNDPMSVIAASCGFVDQSHFSREFRRHFGQSPREYREYYINIRTGGGRVPPTPPSQESQEPGADDPDPQ
jgi:AraC-like DNA-binding protein